MNRSARFTRSAILAVLLSLAAGAPLQAQSLPASSPPQPVVFAVTFKAYWNGFVDFWTGSLKKQSGVVLLAAGVGVASIFIITRGKYKK